jgi:predicted transcriptional regulator
MAKSSNASDPVLAEMISIRRLLVFALLKSGASQDQVASALGVDQSGVSRMFSAPKKVKGGRGKRKT